jgi:ketol-acid reductoisomerase
MEIALKEIRNGKFVREWLKEKKRGGKRYSKLLSESRTHPIEKVGTRLRDRMSWRTKRNSI